MRLAIDTYKTPLAIKLVVATERPEKIRIRVFDANNENCVYQDRYKTISGKSDFYIRMPQSPEKCFVDVFNMKNGNKNGDPSFIVSSSDTLKLKRKFSPHQIKQKDLKEFLEFAMWFSEKANSISAGKDQPSVYGSRYGTFRINYYDDFTTPQGVVIPTPSKIGVQSGIIDCAKNMMGKYTVPMNMAILLHEFAHFYINKDIIDEEEADYNALLIYLGLGYPRIEAEKVFTRVFKQAPSEKNVLRYKKLHSMINNFEKVGMSYMGANVANKDYYYNNEA